MISCYGHADKQVCYPLPCHTGLSQTCSLAIVSIPYVSSYLTKRYSETLRQRVFIKTTSVIVCLRVFESQEFIALCVHKYFYVLFFPLS